MEALSVRLRTRSSLSSPCSKTSVPKFLAEYFEVTGRRAGRVNVEYASWLSNSIANGWRPDLRRLEKLSDVSHMQRTDYQEAWGWVHYLLHASPESRDVLLGYLNELRDNSQPSVTFESKLQEVIPGFRDRYLSYVATLQMRGHDWTATARSGHEWSL